MELICHGGACCGVKTIKTFGFYSEKHPSVYPGVNTRASRLEKVDRIYSDHAYPGRRFFHHEAPEETYLERLDRYLEYLDKYRPNCICEAVLAEYAPNCGYVQYEHWKPYLEERGFVEVSSCYNSNSGHRVHIFHRVKDRT